MNGEHFRSQFALQQRGGTKREEGKLIQAKRSKPHIAFS